MGERKAESGESLYLPILSLIGCGLYPALFDTGAFTSGGTWLVRDANQAALVSSFRPGNGGDLVFVGDVDAFRSADVSPEESGEGSMHMNDHVVFVQNLAQVIP